MRLPGQKKKAELVMVEPVVVDSSLQPAVLMPGAEAVVKKTLLECPTCQTAYPAERLGLMLPTGKDGIEATVRCAVCGKAFNAVITCKEPLGWFRRVVLRQTQDAHTVGVAARE